VKPSKRMLGDKAYDSAELREDLHERGTKPVIPNRCNRKQPFSFSKRIYKLRWRIESAFNRLKDFRRGLCLPRRCPCMVDLMSLDPNRPQRETNAEGRRPRRACPRFGGVFFRRGTRH
jgi:Transposase DDE domain